MLNTKNFWIILAAALVLTAALISLPYLYLSGSREYQRVIIPADGYQLNGYLSTAPETGGKWVIFLHGNRKGGQSEELYRLIRQDLPQGLSVLAIDMRGFGASSNAEMEQAEDIIIRLDDIEAAVEYLEREYGVKDDQIILLGHSLGAAQVMRAALGHSYSQVLAIGLGDWDGLLEDEGKIEYYTEKFLNNTGVVVTPERVRDEGEAFSTTVLFKDCPMTPYWLIFASGDDGLTPLANSYQEANEHCQADVHWSVVPFSDHMYGTESQGLPQLLKNYRTRIMVSLLMWRLNQAFDI